MKKYKPVSFWKPMKIKPTKTKLKSNSLFSFRSVKPIKSQFNSISPVNLKMYPARTKSEWRLIDRKPFGDRDKDKVPNIFDCKPLDKKKQGVIFPKSIKITEKEKRELKKKLRGGSLQRFNPGSLHPQEMKRFDYILVDKPNKYSSNEYPVDEYSFDVVPVGVPYFKLHNIDPQKKEKLIQKFMKERKDVSLKNNYYDSLSPEEQRKIAEYDLERAQRVITREVSQKKLLEAEKLPQKKGLVYRGMSQKEYRDALKKRYFKSDASMNITEGQKNLTIGTKEIRTAAHYASGFAPHFARPIPGDTGIVVGFEDSKKWIHGDSKDKRLTKSGPWLKDIPEGESAFRGKMPISKIKEVYEFVPEEITIGSLDISRRAGGLTSSGRRGVDTRGKWKRNEIKEKLSPLVPVKIKDKIKNNFGPVSVRVEDAKKFIEDKIKSGENLILYRGITKRYDYDDETGKTKVIQSAPRRGYFWTPQLDVASEYGDPDQVMMREGHVYKTVIPHEQLKSITHLTEEIPLFELKGLSTLKQDLLTDEGVEFLIPPKMLGKTTRIKNVENQLQKLEKLEKEKIMKEFNEEFEEDEQDRIEDLKVDKQIEDLQKADQWPEEVLSQKEIADYKEEMQKLAMEETEDSFQEKGEELAPSESKEKTTEIEEAETIEQPSTSEIKETV